MNVHDRHSSWSLNEGVWPSTSQVEGRWDRCEQLHSIPQESESWREWYQDRKLLVLSHGRSRTEINVGLSILSTALVPFLSEVWLFSFLLFPCTSHIFSNKYRLSLPLPLLTSFPFSASPSLITLARVHFCGCNQNPLTNTMAQQDTHLLKDYLKTLF